MRHPLAFADHAAERYLGPGADPGRAWVLAPQNLAARQTTRAFALAIAAACATGRDRDAAAIDVTTTSAAAGRIGVTGYGPRGSDGSGFTGCGRLAGAAGSAMSPRSPMYDGNRGTPSLDSSW